MQLLNYNFWRKYMVGNMDWGYVSKAPYLPLITQVFQIKKEPIGFLFNC